MALDSSHAARFRDDSDQLLDRFVEDFSHSKCTLTRPVSTMTTASATTTTTNTTTTTHNYATPQSSPARGPTTIPIRTSSSRAVLHGDYISGASHKSSKERHSLGSNASSRQRLPEPDEREWMAPSTRNPRTASSVPHQQPSSQSPPAPSLNDPYRFDTDGDLMNGHKTLWNSEKENILRGPYEYLESTPGKDVRSQLITAFNAWLQVPVPSLRIITRVVAMLHTASLLIDDVEDNSLLRRGKPVAHSIFGTAQTINSANYIYFCALQELLTLDNPEVIRIYTEELLNLHRGQGMDLFWRDTLTCPTEDDYLEMVGNKTGGLFRLAIKLMCAESPSHSLPRAGSSSGDQRIQPVDYIPLVNTIGLLFQILDDYRNLSDTTYTQNKGLCEDLTEGKFSFPIIHAIRSEPGNLVLINILKQKTNDDDVKRYAVSYMEGTGSFAYTRRVLRGLTRKALALVDEVDRNSGLEARGGGIRAILDRLRVDKQRDRASMAEISEDRER